MLMRNNAIRNRNTYADHNQDGTERMQLIALNDAEQGISDNNDSTIPPMWTDQLEEAQYTLTKLKTKINELRALHSRHLHRPTFDESSEDETLIENCTADITTMFNQVHRLIQHIKSHTLEGTIKERRLAVNVTRSLATALQDLSVQFRGTQNSYLKQIQSREERSKIYNPALDDDYNLLDEDEIDAYFVRAKAPSVSQQQLLYLEEENTRMAQQREQEVNSIVKSILDLNGIFKELSQMVADQGTILDRIDYNVEQGQIQVFEGFKQLQKADAYQRKNRKMCAILTLGASVILLTFLLIIVKS